MSNEDLNKSTESNRSFKKLKSKHDILGGIKSSSKCIFLLFIH